MPKILFLSTHNLTTNPRLVKEINLALKNKYQAEIICFEFRNWSYKINQQIKNELELAGATIQIIEAGRKPFFNWLIAGITEKIARLFSYFLPLSNSLLANAVSRRSCLLISRLQFVKNADIVVGHNPGALWATVVAGKKFKSKTGFDVEDYHPGEGNDKHLQNLTRKLMTELLPKMDYVSFAAPLIFQQVKKDLHVAPINWFTVLNYFPASDFIEPANLNEGLVKMVWFSQNITADRGLELILPFMKRTAGVVELHLIGNLTVDFYKNYLKDFSNIIIHAPMKQNELHQTLEQFDIGLALEPAKDINNELAISNKMLSCLQAGLFVLATNTPAQEAYLEEYPDHGLCFDYKTNNSEAVLKKMINKINSIRAQKSKRFKKFENRNWEYASLELLNAWIK